MPFAIGGPTSKWAKTAVKSADYTILDTDELGIIFVDDTSTDRTITLPTAADNTDRIITIKNTSTDQGKVTVDGEGAETIDGYATVDLDCKGARIKLISDGSNWQVLEVFFTDKQYSEAAGDFTVTGTGWTTSKATIIPYRGLDGVWRAIVNIYGSMAAASRGGVTLAVSGLTFSANLANSSAGTYWGSGLSVAVYSSAGDIRFNHNTLSTTGYSGTLNWELTAKPTWVE